MITSKLLLPTVDVCPRKKGKKYTKLETCFVLGLDRLGFATVSDAPEKGSNADEG